MTTHDNKTIVEAIHEAHHFFEYGEVDVNYHVAPLGCISIEFRGTRERIAEVIAKSDQLRVVEWRIGASPPGAACVAICAFRSPVEIGGVRLGNGYVTRRSLLSALEADFSKALESALGNVRWASHRERSPKDIDLLRQIADACEGALK